MLSMEKPSYKAPNRKEDSKFVKGGEMFKYSDLKGFLSLFIFFQLITQIAVFFSLCESLCQILSSSDRILTRWSRIFLLASSCSALLSFMLTRNLRMSSVFFTALHILSISLLHLSIDFEANIFIYYSSSVQNFEAGIAPLLLFI